MITVKKDVPAPIQIVLTTPAAAGHRMREPSPTNNHGILRQTGGGCSGGAERGRIVVVAAPPSIAVPHQPLPRLPSATPIVVNGMYGNGPLLLPSPTRVSAGAADPTVLWVPCHFCRLLCLSRPLTSLVRLSCHFRGLKLPRVLPSCAAPLLPCSGGIKRVFFSLWPTSPLGSVRDAPRPPPPLSRPSGRRPRPRRRHYQLATASVAAPRRPQEATRTVTGRRPRAPPPSPLTTRRRTKTVAQTTTNRRRPRTAPPRPPSRRHPHGEAAALLPLTASPARLHAPQSIYSPSEELFILLWLPISPIAHRLPPPAHHAGPSMAVHSLASVKK